MLQLISPPWLARFPDLIAGQSMRSGGVSKPPYDSLNLGLHTDDRPAQVQKNYALLAQHLGIEVEQLAGGYQVHGADIAKVDVAGRYDQCDGFITNTPGVVLTVTVADCLPVLIYDPVQRAVAAAHAGWRSTVADIAVHTLARMQSAFGTQARDCWVWLGACIGFNDFEVGAEVAEHFQASCKRGPDERGKFFVDLRRSNVRRLYEAGIEQEKLACSEISTLSRPEDFFSYRASGDGRTGRGLALIGLRNTAGL